MVRTFRAARLRTEGVSTPVLVAVAVVILGIFAMHALSLHGTMTAAAPTAATALATSDHARMSDHRTSSAHAVAPHASSSAHDGSTDHPGGPDHGGMSSMVMLCVAILAAAAATLLVLLALLRRVPRRLWAVLPLAPPLRVPRPLSPTGTGPPPVWKFSVVRC